MSNVYSDSIPESHKQLVRERIKDTPRNDFKNWTEIRDSFRVNTKQNKSKNS